MSDDDQKPIEAKEWSAEPWTIKGSAIIRPDGQEVTSDRFMSLNDKLRASICVNFCAEVSNEDIRHFADAAKRTQDLPPLEYMAETVQSLRAQLQAAEQSAKLNQEAREWIKSNALHGHGCKAAWNGNPHTQSPCTCGLTALLSQQPSPKG